MTRVSLKTSRGTSTICVGQQEVLPVTATAGSFCTLNSLAVKPGMMW